MKRDWSTECGVRSAKLSRRELLRTSANGFGIVALSAMMSRQASALTTPRSALRTPHSALPTPHFQPRVKNVIFLFMDGGVSHVDSFDPNRSSMNWMASRSSNRRIPPRMAIANG
jgi:hypothetical protein